MSLNSNSASLSASERHALRRRKIEEERAERRKLDEERARRKLVRKKSSTIMAKWHWRGGVRIAGTAVRGFFYAGSNTSGLVRSDIDEPSLINPVESVADSSDGMSKLGAYPMYQYMSPEQRRGYIDFLAGNRDTADDIGFVFLYLYGLERRLLVDASKPGEVSDEEHRSIVGELIRLYDCFNTASRSVAHYIAMLLLYDGDAFNMLSSDDIRRVFCLDDSTMSTASKLRMKTDNVYAGSYMLVSRLISHGVSVPIPDLLCAGKCRLIETRGVESTLLNADSVFDDKVDDLSNRRLHKMRITNLDSSNAKNIGSMRTYPTYYPASPMLRKSLDLKVDRNICDSPESLGAPLKGVADVVMSCINDLDECKATITTSSLRNLGSISIDAFCEITGAKERPLQKYLDGKDGAVIVPISVLEADSEARIGVKLQYTGKGALSSTSQQLIGASAASVGWQCVLPDIVQFPFAKYWDVGKKDDVVMFKRGIVYDLRNGRQCVGPVFGYDIRDYILKTPDDWDEPLQYARLFSWIVSECSELSRLDLSSFPAEYLPKFTKSAKGMRSNQISMFFSLMHAMYSVIPSARMLKQVTSSLPFEDVISMMFTLYKKRFGNVLPADAVEIAERIYGYAGHDKIMVLHDYQSGAYRTAAGSSFGFSIDSDKLAETISDTSSVHNMLNDAISAGTDDEIILGANETDDERNSGHNIAEHAHMHSDDADEDDNGNAAVSNAGDICSEDNMSKVKSCYDTVMSAFNGSDEIATSSLLEAIMSAGLASTKAQAMGVIADMNDAYGDIVDIDGPSTYLDD